MGHWIQSKYESKCSECECDISVGDRIYYEPSEKAGRADVYCAPCGEDADDARKDNDDDLNLEVQ